MPYATAQDLLDRADTLEVLQNLQRNYAVLTEAALLDAVASNDLSGYEADEQAAANDGLARLNTLLADTSAVVDSYCDGQYVLPLNLVPARISADVCKLALYELYGSVVRDDDNVAVDYKATIRWLEMVAKSTVKLGANALGSAAANNSDGLPTMSATSANLFESAGTW